MSARRDISHFRVLDWNFLHEDSKHFLHNFSWYPSRFIPIIPAHLIQALSKENETVLDPFCGSGTAIIEALKLKRNAIGIDINPIGTFIAQVKARIMTGKILQIGKLVEFNLYLQSKLQDVGSNDVTLFNRKGLQLFMSIKEIPNFEENSDWYHPSTLAMLADIYRYIESELAGLTKDICKIFFISILMNSSGYPIDKNYAYFADNVKPKGDKACKNAYKLYQHKLDKLITDYAVFDRRMISSNTFHIYRADARTLRSLFHDKVDLIVTSPPYLNVTDYTTSFRLAYLWYDFLNHDQMIEVKKQEIGARWRRKQGSKLTDYINSMDNALTEMAACLKRERYLCLIIGESKKYSETINNIIIDILTKKLNHELVETFTRAISKKFFMHPNGGGVQTEEILIFRKRGMTKW
jgi:site-specific DNA-methyltransferase (cytosine-N4-specific)